MFSRYGGRYNHCMGIMPEQRGRNNMRGSTFVTDAEYTPPNRMNDFCNQSPVDILVSKRRLKSAVCLFGGTIGTKPKPSSDHNHNRSSIFRSRPCNGQKEHNFTHNAIKNKYEQTLPSRYYEHNNRLSWEVEEQPPIEIVTDDEEGSGMSNYIFSHMGENDDMTIYSKDGDACYSRASSKMKCALAIIKGNGEGPKMKYRCKLCGQLKQNHICPYQHSLQRDIGTMTYPSVNNKNKAGKKSSSISEIKKKSALGDDQPPIQMTPSKTHATSKEITPSKPRERKSNAPHVTPDSKVVSVSDKLTPDNKKSGDKKRSISHHQPTLHAPRTKRNAYLDGVEIKPEQYRFLKPRKASSVYSYKYPSLPLTYGQRKQLSDSLFSLTNDIVGLTEECAKVLRDARETDSWDHAVAELITQVLVIANCHKGDNRMEGLSQYLLTHGIFC